MYVSPCQLANTGASLSRQLLENITYEFVLTSPVMLSMSCSSYLDDLWDRRSCIYNTNVVCCLSSCYVVPVHLTHPRLLPIMSHHVKWMFFGGENKLRQTVVYVMAWFNFHLIKWNFIYSPMNKQGDVFHFLHNFLFDFLRNVLP